MEIQGQIPSWPDQVFAERRESLFLIMTKHLKDNGLSLYVLHKGFGHLHCDLTENRQNKTNDTYLRSLLTIKT